MIKKSLLALSLVFATQGAYASEYVIDTTKSKIAFSGQQAGTDFNGVFEKWQAKVTFDAKKLGESHLDVTIDTGSAKTGNAMYDGTLPQEDWFDSKKFSEATFKSTKITHEKDGKYKAEGDLKIRDITKPASFSFTLSPHDAKAAPVVTAKSTFAVDRLAYDMGVKSDPKAEWVSKDIAIALDITATEIAK